MYWINYHFTLNAFDLFFHTKISYLNFSEFFFCLHSCIPNLIVSVESSGREVKEPSEKNSLNFFFFLNSLLGDLHPPLVIEG